MLARLGHRRPHQRRRPRRRPVPAARDARRAGRLVPPVPEPLDGPAAAGATAMTLADLLAALGDLSTGHHGRRGRDGTAGAAPSPSTRGACPRAPSSSRVRGQKADGAAFVAQALAKGALAVVAEDPAAARRGRAVGRRVATAAPAMARLAAAFYGWPSRELQVVGITGTNGKTTTAYLLSGAVRGGRRPVRDARHRRLPHRRRGARGDPHDTRGDRHPADAARDGGRRLRGLRDGGVVARARPAPRGRGRLRCRRSSRTSPAITSTSTATWSRTSRRSGACSRCCRPAPRRRSTWTTREGPPWWPSPARPVDLRGGPAGRRHPFGPGRSRCAA